MKNFKDKISIIVVAYDQPELLKNNLVSLVENTSYKNFEIIISHNRTNASIEGKVKEVYIYLNNLYPKIFSYVLNNKNLKFGPGIMEGFKLSTGELICVLNDDTFFPPEYSDWLEKLVNFVNEDLYIATLTPSMYHKSHTVYWIGKKNPAKPLHDFLHVKENHPSLPTEPYEVCYNNMACCLIRRELIEEFPIGSDYAHYGSDSGFCSRVKAKYPKMKHMILPEAKIIHFNSYDKRNLFTK